MKNRNDKTPGHVPERKQPGKENTGYANETELETPQEGSDASFSEQTDVTPPNKKEFPSVGPAETDFVSRPYRRSTGRMVGHEPGTENNL